MNPTASFLGEQLRAYDPLVVSVAEVAGQDMRATIERVYSARFSGPVPYAAGTTLHFVGAPGSWGNVTLKPSERALVFVAYIASSKRHYQCPWHGHFSLEDAAGGPLAVANWRPLDRGPWEPEALWRSAFLLDEKVPWRVAMPFAALERYILEEIGRIGAAEPGVPPDGTASFC